MTEEFDPKMMTVRYMPAEPGTKISMWIVDGNPDGIREVSRLHCQDKIDKIDAGLLKYQSEKDMLADRQNMVNAMSMYDDDPKFVSCIWEPSPSIPDHLVDLLNNSGYPWKIIEEPIL